MPPPSFVSKTVSEVSPVPQETTPVEPAKENVFVQETFENSMQEAVFKPDEVKVTAPAMKKAERKKAREEIAKVAPKALFLLALLPL